MIEEKTKKYCVFCGQLIGQNQQFCVNCGKRVVSNPSRLDTKPVKITLDKKEEEIAAAIRKNKDRNVKFKDKTVDKLRAKMGWKGSGSKEDPIIIDNIIGLKPNLWFQTSGKYHFIIKNVNVFKIYCRNTQNIAIDHCNVYRLEIEASYNMLVKNNTIFELRVVNTKASTFSYNRTSNENIKDLEEGYADQVQKFMNKGLAGLITLFSTMAVIMLFFNWIVSLAFIGIMFMIILLLKMFRKQEDRTAGMQPNILLDNIPIKDANSEFKLILQTYANLKKQVLVNYLPEIIGGLIGAGIAIVICLYAYFL